MKCNFCKKSVFGRSRLVAAMVCSSDGVSRLGLCFVESRSRRISLSSS